MALVPERVMSSRATGGGYITHRQHDFFQGISKESPKIRRWFNDGFVLIHCIPVEMASTFLQSESTFQF
ncbi:hypothetical protein K443DRAFT_349029 [Laccaria amethystina LaAM-08-1]|uniref:Uncharacterized protein n=1 Tax=Laccaria amethystina LaAM-08-1 TaxID=1095629 RepID=A0A0C9XF52_9AGAR|nr:hypothetical protein K443DRAFT_349029 [Laccaria amethystina LaAM-08-1]